MLARYRKRGSTAASGGSTAAPLVVASNVLVNSYSLEGGYFQDIGGDYSQPATGDDTMLVAIVHYQAAAAGARSFTLPTFNGDNMVEGLAPTSAGDKSDPGVAIYYLAAPDAGLNEFLLDTNEDLISLSVVLVSLTGAKQSSAIDDTAGTGGGADAATLTETLESEGAGRLIIGGGVLQGYDGSPSSSSNLTTIEKGVTNTANLFNDHAYFTGWRAASAAGDYDATVTFMASDGIGTGFLAIIGSGASGGGSGGGSGVPVDPPSGLRFTPGNPASTVDVITVVPGSDVTATGNATKDALVVMPASQVTQQFSVEVTGYRRIYMIGGSMKVIGRGTKTTPSGETGRGQNWFFWFETHKDAVDAQIYVGRMHVENDPDTFSSANSQYGDIFNLGGDVNSSNDNFANWPDIYLDNILCEGGLHGWSADLVAHSDFFKCEPGAFKSLSVNRVDADFGYQTFYLTPTYASDFTPHPTGRINFYDTVARIIRTTGAGLNYWTEFPKGFYFSRGSSNVDAGEYYPTTFRFGGADGGGVWMPQHNGIKNVHPSGGAYAPNFSPAATIGGFDYPNRYYWDEENEPFPGKPFVSGQLFLAEPSTPVVTSSGVGTAYRIANKTALEALIASL